MSLASAGKGQAMMAMKQQIATSAFIRSSKNGSNRLAQPKFARKILVQTPFFPNIAHFCSTEEAAVSDADRGERAVEIVGPEVEKLDEAWKFRSKVELLPDERLQNVVEIGHT